MSQIKKSMYLLKNENKPQHIFEHWHAVVQYFYIAGILPSMVLVQASQSFQNNPHAQPGEWHGPC